jgi:hypothetical protein
MEIASWTFVSLVVKAFLDIYSLHSGWYPDPAQGRKRLCLR